MSVPWPGKYAPKVNRVRPLERRMYPVGGWLSARGDLLRAPWGSFVLSTGCANQNNKKKKVITHELEQRFGFQAVGVLDEDG